MVHRKTLHVAMFPWFAMGHLTSFLHLSNKLAERGHRVSFLLPPKAQFKLNPFNCHPDLITFFPVPVPHVDGLPPGAETTNDVSISQSVLISIAMDRTERNVENLLRDLKPDFVFFDFSQWLPALARSLGIKAIHYCIMSAATVAYLLTPVREEAKKMGTSSALTLMQQPQGFPKSTIKLQPYEARLVDSIERFDFNGVRFHERVMTSLRECDAIAFRSCKEIEGNFGDYVETQFSKPVLLSGTVVPSKPNSSLEERWNNWLGGYKPGSVVYCSFGSECILKKDQMQELLLGLELTQLPFFVALKAPEGTKRIEEAFPDGFEARVGGRGVVYSGWVQQQLILRHPSVGCFVTHCGFGSVSEALVNECQLVLLPHSGDQFVSARLMSGDLKVGLEIKRGEEEGWYTRESVCKAVKMILDEDSEIGREVRANRAKWREILLRESLESSHVESFIKQLQGLLGCELAEG